MSSKDWFGFFVIEGIFLGLTILAYIFPNFDYGTCYAVDVLGILVERNFSAGYTAGWCYRYVGMAPYITLMVLGIIGQIQLIRLRKAQAERARKR